VKFEGVGWNESPRVRSLYMVVQCANFLTKIQQHNNKGFTTQRHHKHNTTVCCVVVVLWTEHTIILQHKRSGNFTLPLCCDVICRFRFVKWKFLDLGFQNVFFEKRVNCCRQCHKAQSPFIRFVWICCTTVCTTDPQKIHNILTCCGFVVDLYSKSTTSSQQIEIVEFGFRQVVDLSWRCSQSQRALLSRDDYVECHLEGERAGIV